MKREAIPANCRLHWAPAATRGRLARARYESGAIAAWAAESGVTSVVQLNGMIVPAMKVPTLSHNQDPWPYRPEAWSGLKDRAVALLKRRAHARAVRDADCMGWTSGYLRDLVCSSLKVRPRRSEVFYNGLPDDWLERARRPLPPWDNRPMEIVSVSNVGPYKRQALVIRALPELVCTPGLERLVYRVAGEVSATYRQELDSLAVSLGVSDHVVIEGRVSDQHVQKLYTSAKCFVLMSVCESFGIPAVEAMSFGTPVVTSDCCAMPEVCGPAADLSPMDDVGALTKNLRRVLMDPDHAEQLRKLGAERVQAFSWRATAERMAKCLEYITRDPGKSA